MRLERIRIDNYKGLRSAEIPELGGEPIVAISGRNGTGKSLILEAVASVWNHRFFNPSDLVGPWGEECVIEVEASLSEIEADALREFAGSAGEGPITVRAMQTLQRQGGQSLADSPEMSILRNQMFRKLHPFALLDFLPATRHVPMRQTATIDPELFGEKRTQQERDSYLNDFLQNRAIRQFPGVKSFLATLHYLDMLAANKGTPVDGFGKITAAFKSATGKQIEEPEIDVESGAAIRVMTRSEIKHDLDGLSSGEQEALALMYFIRRVDTRGGVLLIDEPEQHLHPALQASFFEIALTMADRAQLVVVTHSPKLLAMAPPSALVRVQDAADCAGNQVGRADDWPARETLFSDLGLTAVDLVQHDFIVVVEGESDEAWLSALMPVALSRASVVRAGSYSAVERMRDALSAADQMVPWICVRDRDFLDEEARAQRNALDGMYVLARRDIENLLLSADLISRTFTRAGADLSVDDAEALLSELAGTQRDEVLEHLVEARLAAELPVEPTHEGGRWDRARERYAALAGVNSRRAEAFDDVLDAERANLERTWLDEWPALVDGKVMLRMLTARSPFQDEPSLVAALRRTCNDEPGIRPAALVELIDQVMAIADSA